MWQCPRPSDFERVKAGWLAGWLAGETMGAHPTRDVEVLDE